MAKTCHVHIFGDMCEHWLMRDDSTIPRHHSSPISNKMNGFPFMLGIGLRRDVARYEIS